MSFKILVMSCDKNEDLWKPYYLCMEKYWANHPEIIYCTETIDNPYYKTIKCNYPIDKWTKRVVDCVNQLDCDNVLLMIDDLFIRKEVNNELLNCMEQYIGGIIGGLNLEKSFDKGDILLDNQVALRNPFGKFKTSLMCQLWSKKAMLDIFNVEKDPWLFEQENNSKQYVFLISRYGNFIDWGYGDRKWFGIRKGKWCKECKEFFDKEGIEIDYSIRGFYE